jgi:coenzyme F420-0:L-glutamate ligase / coenzyme F420-1:gamma-L-glutamate ligase
MRRRKDRPQELRAIPVPFSQEVRPGDSLAEMIADGVKCAGLRLVQGDILVVKHKIVSKAEGQLVKLDTVRPSRSSRDWGKRFAVDSRVTELALSQSKRVVRRKHGVLITETRHGLVCANSGVDVSNVNGGGHALLLPENPDRSAARLHRALRKRFKISLPVIITDSFGRAWREGLTEAAIGVAGMKALRDHRGERDPHGYRLRVSVEAVADELACAAGLVCGKLARTPVCLIRGFSFQPGRGKAKDLIRQAAKDLFR